jgi:hypothetical protein
LPPARERAKSALKGIISLAQELRGDPASLRFLHSSLGEVVQAIGRELAPAPIGG